MLDITEGLVATGNSRESEVRDTLTAHVTEVADQLPKFERTQVVTLAWIGEQVGDDTLGKFDTTEGIDDRTLANARQNARNWTQAAVQNRYPGFVDGKFEFYAVPIVEAGKTTAVRFALRGVKPKATDEV